jgi:Tfp pilus assembly protein PilZ
MIQNREKRICPRSDGKLFATIEDLSFGLSKAVIINYNKMGAYIETNCPFRLGIEIYIGIKSSPYKSFVGKYECYRAKIIRQQKSLYTEQNYGYGIKYTFVDDIQNTKNQQYIVIKNLRKYLRKPYPFDISFILNNQLIEGSIKNISPDGAFIETQKSFSGGEIVKLHKLKDKNDNSKLVGKVVWHNANGIGIQFLKSNKT